MPTRRLSYREIADDLAARITNGEYPPEGELPSYAELAVLYSVSVATIARAIGLLRDRGIVRGEPGRGTYIVEK